jgi:hypothetical protein
MKERYYNKEDEEVLKRIKDGAGDTEAMLKVLKAYRIFMKEVEKETALRPRVKGKKIKLFKNTKEAK